MEIIIIFHLNKKHTMKTFLKQLFQLDKLIHNLINYSIVFTLSVLTNYLIGLCVALTLSLLKEFIWDKLLKKGNFEIADLVSNGLGIIEGTIMYLIYIIL